MEDILRLLLIAGLLSIVINVLLKKYDFPPIIGYIFAGAFITYTFSLRDTSLHILYDIAEFGIAFLMFTIGLEFSLPNFKKLKKEVFLFGSLQVLLSALLFVWTIHYFFLLSIQASFVIGFALALSSTAIVLKILNDNREIKKQYGRIVLGILIFQDLAVIPILLMIAFFTTKNIALDTLLINTFISILSVIGILYFVSKYLLTPFLSFVFDSNSHELIIGSILLIAIAASYTAYHFGFSYSLGAFIGGMLLAETPFKHQIEADLTPFRDLLLGVFFVTVGLQISIDFMLQNIVNILSIMIVVMLLKGIVVLMVLALFTTKSNALKSSIALAQVGEFSFVVLELSRIGGITTKDINQTLIIAVVFSMILTPFIVRKLELIVSFLLREKQKEFESIKGIDINNHIVVIGYSSLGQQICKVIRSYGLPYITIDNNRHRIIEAKEYGDPFILGNAYQQHILSEAHISEALAVIIAIENDEATKTLIESIYHISPTINIIVSSRNDTSELSKDYRIASFIHEHREVAHSMVKKAISCDIESLKS